MDGEDLSETFMTKVLNFLSAHRGKKFTVYGLMQEMQKENIEISYPTVLKWSEVLIAKGLIKVEVYGAVKIVWFE